MRVITGSARGVQLKTPEGMLTRPTADRVKEALFSILQFELPGKKILDLYCGAGTIGLSMAKAICEREKFKIYADYTPDERVVMTIEI